MILIFPGKERQGQDLVALSVSSGSRRQGGAISCSFLSMHAGE